MSQNCGRLDNYTDCRYLLELLDLLYVTLFQCQSALLLIRKVINYLINVSSIHLLIDYFKPLLISQ